MLQMGLLSLVIQTPEKVINVNGLERSYIDYVPSNLDENSSVLLAYHGSGQSATEFRKIIGSAVENFANINKYVVVYLSGYKGNFNDCRKKAKYPAKLEKIDDIGFTKSILEKVRKDTSKDLKNVYALGYSNGAHFAYRLVIEEPDLVKGILAISANLPVEDNMDCIVSSSQSTPNIAIIQGERDKVNPLRGGDAGGGLSSRGRVLSTKETTDWFIKKYSMIQTKSQWKVLDSNGLVVTNEAWNSGTSKILVTLLRTAGHTIPQESYTFPMSMGETYRDNSIIENSLQSIRNW
jgi:polyhydroxybutyrate depolymerase